jgi:single-stranded-DNA-specific exonuclease
MGEERQHARFTLVTGGSRSRGVAFSCTPRSLSAAGAEPHDLAVRLERNRWNGAVEPRVVLRAVCPTRPGELRVLGEEEPFWERLERVRSDLQGGEGSPEPIRACVAAPGAGEGERRAPLDRRHQGFAGVAGELLTSGEPVLVAVADVARRRASLEALVGGLAEDGLAVASWSALSAHPSLAQGFAHLVALDPPPGGRGDALLHGGGALTHLAWGIAEVEFSLAVWRAELDLGSPLRLVWRALRELSGAHPTPGLLEEALRGGGRYPRSPEVSARLLQVLVELALVDFVPGAAGGPRCVPREAERTDLERSPTYRACRRRLQEIERELGAELPAPRPVAALAAPV